jgi:hypothetical protein
MRKKVKLKVKYFKTIKIIIQSSRTEICQLNSSTKHLPANLPINYNKMTIILTKIKKNEEKVLRFLNKIKKFKD